MLPFRFCFIIGFLSLAVTGCSTVVSPDEEPAPIHAPLRLRVASVQFDNSLAADDREATQGARAGTRRRLSRRLRHALEGWAQKGIIAEGGDVKLVCVVERATLDEKPLSPPADYAFGDYVSERYDGVVKMRLEVRSDQNLRMRSASAQAQQTRFASVKMTLAARDALIDGMIDRLVRTIDHELRLPLAETMSDLLVDDGGVR